ncbi:MAG: Diguanylate cyclase protein [Rubritepida sp.]|nr:Diguanylate cyclase protein [Rubritepida sp.]
MMLANGGVLGLIYRDLPAALRPSARSWQAGTLLNAAGCALCAFQSQLPLVPLVTAANGLILFGLTIYWRSLQQFYDLPAQPWQYLPAIGGTLAVFWFSAFHPDTTIRIVLISMAWLILMGGCVSILTGRTRRDTARSRQMLLALFIAIMVLTAFRAVFFVAAGVPADFSIADNASWMNLASPLVSAIMPVIGTTAFALMCSERLRRQWERAASTDYLTGLANRRTLTETGQHRFQQSRIRDGGIALALIDIDNFKSINDQYGHEAGDLALKQVAACLRTEVGLADILARTGGEEFVVLLGETEPGQAQLTAERLRLAVQRHSFILRGAHLPLTVSVGIAVSRAGDTDFDSLLRRADQAMYAAKAGGRNRIELAA